VKHTWNEKGTYNITAKAKDIHDFESDWGKLEVTMPKNKVINFNFLQRLFEWFPNIFQIMRHLFEL
jgi:DNA relaxase NicK